MTIHQFELNGIHHLQNGLRGPWTDTFFSYWDYVDSVGFVFIFVAAIMYLFSRKEGISLLFILIISSVANMLLKSYFQFPRPCQLDSLVGILCYPTFGFPSGAAQTATIIVGLAFAKCHRNIYKIAAVLFALLFCFSRVYLGLHFFTDILGGMGVGIGLLVIYFKLFPLLEKHWALFGFGLSLVIFLLGGTEMLPQAAITLGIASGLWFSKQNKLVPAWPLRILTFFIVILGSMAFVYLGELYPLLELPAILLAGFWFSYLGSKVVSYCCNRLKIL